MVIHRKNGEVLEANLINGELVTLKQFKNNSAPHSKCAFFKMTPGKVECTFPKDLTKKCQIQKGTYNGWDTTEYVKTYIGIEDSIAKQNT